VASIKVFGIFSVQRKLYGLTTPVDKETAEKMGKAIVDGIRAETEKAVSPITGSRFAPLGTGTSDRYKKFKRRAGKGGKADLRFSGKFMRSLRQEPVKRGNQWAASVGYDDAKSKKKEQGHREGAGGQAERPTIPEGRETFSKRISTVMIRILEERVRKILRAK
jgi:hypothetical protein